LVNNFDINLNPIEEVIYAYESDNFSFNCGLIIEFNKYLNSEKLKSSIELLIRRFPILKTKIIFDGKLQRVPLPSISIKDILTINNTAKVDKQNFVDKFEIHNKPAFHFILSNTEGSSTLKFFIHHTLVDGLSQANILKELMYIYSQGQPSEISYTRPALSNHRLGKWAVFKLFFNSNFKTQFKSTFKKYNCLNIGTISNVNKQDYGIVNIKVDKDNYTNINQKIKNEKCTSFTYILNSLCLSLHKSKPESNNNIVVAFPVNLRPLFKLKSYIGNLVILTRIEVPIDKLKKNTSISYLKKSLRATISKKFLTHSKQIIFGLGSIFSISKLKKIFLKKTTFIKNFNSSIMVSYIKIDDGFFPTNIKVNKISLLSAIFKSPGLGAVIAEYENSYQITITYCKPEVSELNIKKFIANLRYSLDLSEET